MRHQLVPQSPTGCLTWGQGLRSARGPRLPGTRRVWRRPGRGGGWRWGPAAPGPGDLSACPRQVLETCVKNCGHRFHVLVANRDFVDSVLVKVISPKNSPPAIVQDKVLALIQVGPPAPARRAEQEGLLAARLSRPHRLEPGTDASGRKCLLRNIRFPLIPWGGRPPWRLSSQVTGRHGRFLGAWPSAAHGGVGLEPYRALCPDSLGT